VFRMIGGKLRDHGLDVTNVELVLIVCDLLATEAVYSRAAFWLDCESILSLIILNLSPRIDQT
jgi:hypothetical protein